MKKEIRFQIPIPAPRSKVWEAWTTEKGAKTFFASACKIDRCFPLPGMRRLIWPKYEVR